MRFIYFVLTSFGIVWLAYISITTDDKLAAAHRELAAARDSLAVAMRRQPPVTVIQAPPASGSTASFTYLPEPVDTTVRMPLYASYGTIDMDEIYNKAGGYCAQDSSWHRLAVDSLGRVIVSP